MSSGRLNNTYTWIKRQVEELASERSIQTDRAFAVWSMKYVYPLLDTDEALMQTLLQSPSIIYMDSEDSTLPPEWEAVVAR